MCRLKKMEKSEKFKFTNKKWRPNFSQLGSFFFIYPYLPRHVWLESVLPYHPLREFLLSDMSWSLLSCRLSRMERSCLGKVIFDWKILSQTNLESIRQQESSMISEDFDIGEDVIPSTTIQSDNIISKSIDDLIHLNEYLNQIFISILPGN